MSGVYADEWLTVYQGDCRAVMASMEPESVHCVVTSPPYWGLRDYGDAGQLGLEPTPEEYVANLVAVFREVRRVLRSDGTVWLNLGDSYVSTTLNGDAGGSFQAERRSYATGPRPRRGPQSGLKPKDLVGIPWRVAFALQQPYYAGNIKREADRAWLAAMIDGEGSIDINRLKAGRRPRESFGAYVRVHNTSEALVRRCAELAGVGSVNVSEEREGRQRVYVWATYGDNARMVLREVYPYLIAKQQQARLAAHPSDETCAAIRLLHHGTETTIDRPAPESALEPGWYLRSDIIWAKPNPMPESVTDRPTKSHEYLFLLSKSPRYYFDADAVREANDPLNVAHNDRYGANGHGGKGAPDRNDGGRYNGGVGYNPAGRNIRSVWTLATQPYPGAHFATFPRKLVEPCIKAGTSERGVCPECGAPWERVVERGESDYARLKGDRDWRDLAAQQDHRGASQNGTTGRNTLTAAGTVPSLRAAASQTTGWQPSCAHTADPISATVLDPFAGSGTTGLVAQSLSRRAILIDLNADYLIQAMGRNRDIPLGLAG